MPCCATADEVGNRPDWPKAARAEAPPLRPGLLGDGLRPGADAHGPAGLPRTRQLLVEAPTCPALQGFLSA